MKKILAYSFVAVFLGVATMLAPLALYINEMDMQAEQFYSSPTEYMKARSSETEQMQGIQPVTQSNDTMSIVSLFFFSFVVALGIMSLFKGKILGSSLP